MTSKNSLMVKGLSSFFAMGALLVWGGRVWADGTVSSTPVVTPVQTVTADKPAPFSFADFTWMNGNSRVKDNPLDSKYFTPEITMDVHYIYDFAHPIDHVLVGTTEGSLVNEVEVQDVGIGGDLHVDNVIGRILTQFGTDATQTVRNDASPGVGTTDLANAYRYLSEAWGGYHFDVDYGLNVEAGIFMSYIGLFSYYSPENWTYQPSYVSSNTPWFFNGVRIQWFPEPNLKIEPWIINGWQSYGEFNQQPGLGYQIKWAPNADISTVFNGYWGTDNLGAPGLNRIHSDNSLLVKYVDNPKAPIDKVAFSFTVDYGQMWGAVPAGLGLVDTNGNQVTNITPAQENFFGGMLYNRFWFDNDHQALTLGGGWMTNTGRYLVLLPDLPNGQTGGANAINYASPYFTENPGDPFTGWDWTVTWSIMPSQYLMWQIEYNHRGSSVPYFNGPGGVTSPNGVNVGANGGYVPNLVTSEDRINLACELEI
jgi:hypothetical protein